MEDPGAASCTAAMLFGVVWESLSDIIGTAATATLLHRSARRAVGRSPDLDGLSISRDGFVYAYRLPTVWNEARPEPIAALRELLRELSPLLVELTGAVILRRLAALPDLRRCDLFVEELTR